MCGERLERDWPGSTSPRPVCPSPGNRRPRTPGRRGRPPSGARRAPRPSRHLPRGQLHGDPADCQRSRPYVSRPNGAVSVSPWMTSTSSNGIPSASAAIWLHAVTCPWPCGEVPVTISTFTEMCGLAPSRILSALKYVAGGWETSTVRITPTGKVEVVTGTSPHGQGHVTAWSQIAADALGIPFDDIEVIHGDTKMAPHGMDTYGSRSLVIGGIAVLQAAERVVEKARVIAAHQLECDPGDLDFEGGVFKVRGTPGTEKAIQAVAFEAFTAHDLPDGVEPTLVGRRHPRPATVLLPARHAPVRGRGRHRDRSGVDPRVRRRRRHRQRRQPDDRRGPGARRHRAGHRPGAVRGGGLRRRRATWSPAPMVDYLVPSARRPARLRHRPHRHAVDDQRARRQGCRRGRHDRLDARPWSTPSSTRCDRWASTTSGCRARRRTSGARCRTRPRRERAEARSDPRELRLRPGPTRSTRRSRPSRPAARTPRCSPAGSR